jgi:hypothetical protein
LSPAADGLWLIGAEPGVPVRALRGYTYLRELLRRPGQTISALELLTEGRGSAMQPSLGETLDRTAVEAYRRRLGELDHELAEAEEWADLGRIEAIASERDALVNELSAAFGFGGRPRKTGSSSERARVAATKAITLAISRIAAMDEQLGQHLRASVHTGIECSYEPSAGDAFEWILDP